MHERPTFYFDRNVGRRLPEILREAKPPFEVAFHHDPANRFPPDMPDDEWLAIIGERDWIAFSHDRRWSINEPERMAITQYGIGCFSLWGGEVSIWVKLGFFVRRVERIAQLAATTPKPFLFHVPRTGRIQRVPLGRLRSSG
jgi:hypothetical protein